MPVPADSALIHQALHRLFPGYSAAMLEDLAVRCATDGRFADDLTRLALIAGLPERAGSEHTRALLRLEFDPAALPSTGDAPVVDLPDPEPRTTLPAGSIIGGGRYQVDKRLGEGRFGLVYRAFVLDTPGRLPCVVKQLPLPTDPLVAARVRAMLQNEAEILFALGGGKQEANLPDLYAAFPEELCLVMTAVEGDNLATLLARDPTQFTIAVTLGVMEDVSTALTYLHRQQIVHHDVKPGNLIRDPAGHIWLADFGVGRSLAQLLDASGVAIRGTPFFAPPEQLAGRSEERSDIYALGITAAVLLTGLPPIYGPVGLLAALRATQPPVPDELLRLLSSCVHPDVTRRPAATELLAEVRRLRLDQGEIAEIRVPELIAKHIFAGEYGAVVDQIERERWRLTQEQRERITVMLQAVRVEQPSDQLAEALLSAALAELSWQARDLAKAERLCHQGIAALPAILDGAAVRALLLKRLGTIYGDQQLFTQSDDTLQAALHWAKLAGERRLEGRVWHNIGIYADERDKLEAAREAYHHSLRIHEELDDRVGAIESLNNLGVVSLTQGQVAMARGYFQQCRDLSKQARRPDVVGAALTNLGTLQFDQGDLVTARDTLAIAERLCAATTQPLFQAICLYTLGEIALLEGESVNAANYSNRAIAVIDPVVDQAYLSRALCVLGKVAVSDGQYEEAERLLRRAWRHRGEEAYDQTFLLEARAELAYGQGRLRAAHDYCRKARVLAASGGAKLLVTRLEQLEEQIRVARKGALQ